MPYRGWRAHLTANTLRLGFNMVKLGFSVYYGLILFLHFQFFHLYDVRHPGLEIHVQHRRLYDLRRRFFCIPFQKTVLSPSKASSAV